ncbi:VWA domain-containing protein [Prevotella sp. E13-17]|uniref:vWA domain-containing protein n=1 Tax=Prevotella sp. E13-17 TaxID=2913616 RepID=UPI001EDA6630|nr:VWA domain-containing protein [Prevotella sp. E13-17]UKK49814.1 VWA domain-containing protein [Prevotella sp. E13-17]
MFRFENPEYLWLVSIVIVLALIYIVQYFKRKSSLRKFGDPNLLYQLMPDVSRWRGLIKFLLLELSLVFMIIMLARPQEANQISEEKRSGIETMIAIDISNSMLAEDVTPSRLDRAKMLVEGLVETFSDDKIGLIIFAGDAFVQLPITNDYVSAKMFLNSIEPSMIVNQGTDIASAINMASHSFTQQEHVGKAIIVITDGEDHEGGALEAAKEAKDNGMNIYMLGIGTSKGAPIPNKETGGYMIDRTGETVLSRLNEDMCKEIAQAGGGVYIHVDNSSSAQQILDKELDKLEKSDSAVYSNYSEQFQTFGVIALILLIIEIVLLERKNHLLNKIKIFK